MKRANVIVGAVIFLSCAGILVWGVLRMRQHQALGQCTNNLKQLSLALHNYHDVYKKLPLAVATSSFGRVQQTKVVDLPVEQCASWLFELDPFIHARMDPLFTIDINKPWDAEENRYPADAVFYGITNCPANSAADKSKTQ